MRPPPNTWVYVYACTSGGWSRPRALRPAGRGRPRDLRHVYRKRRRAGSGVAARPASRVGAWAGVRASAGTRGMQPWPPRSRGPRDLTALEEAAAAPLAGADVHEAWSAGEAVGEEPPGALPASPRTRVPAPCWTPRELRHPDPGAEPTWGAPLSPVPVAPPTPARVMLLAPWDPNYETARGPGCSSGASFSSRTLYHPSFWPLYQAAAGRDPQEPPSEASTGPRSAFTGVPVLSREDIFLSDPLLPQGQRVPMYLSEPPGQAKGSLKLLLPPPIMAPWVLPRQTRGHTGTWLSGAELIALTGLLQMSQGPPRPSSAGAPDDSADAAEAPP